jgi:plasmid stabilization system protein ParE
MAKQYRVVIARQARDELRKELDYIRRRSSVQQAKNVNRGIQEAIKSLATFPKRHQKMEQIGTEQRVYHSFPKWSFLIIYRVEEKVLRVRVVSIFNTNQKPDKIEDINGR